MIFTITRISTAMDGGDSLRCCAQIIPQRIKDTPASLPLLKSGQVNEFPYETSR